MVSQKTMAILTSKQRMQYEAKELGHRMDKEVMDRGWVKNFIGYIWVEGMTPISDCHKKYLYVHIYVYTVPNS